jgi:hypothetical protein
MLGPADLKQNYFIGKYPCNRDNLYCLYYLFQDIHAPERLPNLLFIASFLSTGTRMFSAYYPLGTGTKTCTNYRSAILLATSILKLFCPTLEGVTLDLEARRRFYKWQSRNVSTYRWASEHSVSYLVGILHVLWRTWYEIYLTCLPFISIQTWFLDDSYFLTAELLSRFVLT